MDKAEFTMETPTDPLNDESNKAVVEKQTGRPFSITMEVPLFLLMIGISLSGVIVHNLLLERTCLHALNYSEEQCRLLHESGEKSNETQLIEQESQKYASIVSMVKSVIEAVCPAFLSLFLGVWSETHGRKPLVAWPLFGAFISSMILVGYSFAHNLGPWWYIAAAVPISLSGGNSALYTGAFTYINDITTNDNKSFRLALLESAIFIGSISGSLMSPVLVKLIGNSWVLCINVVVYIVAYGFTTLCVTESVDGALKGGFTKIFNFQHVKRMVKTCFRKRPHNLRAVLIMIILANSFSVFVLHGMANLDYLYTRQKLAWALNEYTIYSAVHTITMVAGLLIGVTLIQKVFKLGDLLLTTISYISSITEVLFKAFATVTWHMYLGTSISILRGVAGPVTRSIMSKILPREDITKVFALSCALDAVCPLLSPLVFNSIYSQTLSTFPGAIYIMSAFIYGVCIIMIGIVHYYLKRCGLIVHLRRKSTAKEHCNET